MPDDGPVNGMTIIVIGKSSWNHYNTISRIRLEDKFEFYRLYYV